MGSDYKRIILLKGLEVISEYQFSIVKSLLARDLRLTRKMQEEYNKVQIADLMERKFPGPACVDKLVNLFKDIEGLGEVVKTLKNEKKKGNGQEPSLSGSGLPTSEGALELAQLSDPFPSFQKSKTTQEDESVRTQPTQEQSLLPGPSATSTQSTCSYPQTPQMPPPIPGSSSATKVPSPSSHACTPSQHATRLSMTLRDLLSHSLLCINSLNTKNHPLVCQKPRLKAVPTEASIEEGFQKGPKEVMVLKATEPFTYDPMKAEKKMFHATVATESQFFQVKVFHVSLKNKFIPKNIIAISDYHGRNGFLELYGTSRVSDVNSDQKMEISSRLIQNAKATPKINTLYSQKPGTFVSGIYQVHKNIILYEIQDNTGKIEVLVYGRLTNINCEEGDKLRLICFELSTDPRQLRSVIHSFIKKQPLGPDSHMKISL
uniref:Gamma-interferon-inducible protein 16 n=1 Tax=Neovison vison TaxID=452646 RepID=A0A8C7EWC9_NEOVI